MKEIKETEEVLLADIYLKDGSLGIRYLPDANIREVLYFLETLVKIEREEFEEMFKPAREDD